jgi:hypothetical protein
LSTKRKTKEQEEEEEEEERDGNLMVTLANISANLCQ